VLEPAPEWRARVEAALAERELATRTRSNRTITLTWPADSLYPAPNIQNHGTLGCSYKQRLEEATNVRALVDLVLEAASIGVNTRRWRLPETLECPISHPHDPPMGIAFKEFEVPATA
jgi:hypothetical protein